jgi:hypothetical protein
VPSSLTGSLIACTIVAKSVARSMPSGGDSAEFVIGRWGDSENQSENRLPQRAVYKFPLLNSSTKYLQARSQRAKMVSVTF